MAIVAEHVFSGHLGILFGEIFIKILGLFLNQTMVFLYIIFFKWEDVCDLGVGKVIYLIC